MSQKWDNWIKTFDNAETVSMPLQEKVKDNNAKYSLSTFCIYFEVQIII